MTSKPKSDAAQNIKIMQSHEYKNFLMNMVFPRENHDKKQQKKEPQSRFSAAVLQFAKSPKSTQLEPQAVAKSPMKSSFKEKTQSVAHENGNGQTNSRFVKIEDENQLRSTSGRVMTAQASSQRVYESPTRLREFNAPRSKDSSLERSEETSRNQNITFRSPKNGQLGSKELNVSKEFEGMSTIRSRDGFDKTFESTILKSPKVTQKIENTKVSEKDVLFYDLAKYIDKAIKDRHSVKFEELKSVITKRDLVSAVIKAPEPHLGNLKFLATYFLTLAPAPLEKIWTSFLWLMYKYAMKEEFQFTPDDYTRNLDHLKKKRSEISLKFATSFENLSQVLGLRCFVIKGYTKDFFYTPGKSLKNYPHAWNAVFHGSKWHLVDCTLASGHFIHGSRWKREVDPAYFMVNPEHFITTHFPEGKNWQLLEGNEKTIEEVENMMPFGLAYYQQNITLEDIKQPMMILDKEEVKLKLKVGNGINLFPEISREAIENTMTNLTYMQRNHEHERIEYDLILPDEAQYYVRLFGKAEGEEDYNLMFTLTLRRDKTSNPKKSIQGSLNPKKGKSNQMAGPFTYLKSYPKINLLFYDQYQAELLSHKYSIYFEQNANDTLQIVIRVANNIQLTADLYREMNNDAIDGAVYVHKKDDLYIFEVIFSETWLYKLVINANVRGTREQKSWIVEYPIYVKILNNATKHLSFPKTDFETFDHYRFETLTHPYNITHNGGTISKPNILGLKFKTVKDTLLHCVLIHPELASTKDLVMYTVERNMTYHYHRVECVFPDPGNYKLQISAQREDLKLGEIAEPEFVMDYDVEVQMPKNTLNVSGGIPFGFPTKFIPNLVILMPTTKYLKSKYYHEFKMEIPRCYEKCIISMDGKDYEMRKSGMMFAAKYKIEEKGTVEIRAKICDEEQWDLIAEYIVQF